MNYFKYFTYTKCVRYLNKSAFFLIILKRIYITGYCSFIRSTVHTEHGTVLVKVKTSEFGNWMKTRSFRTFSLKAHYYPAYYPWKGDDWPNWAVLSNSGISSMKKNVLSCFQFSKRSHVGGATRSRKFAPTDRPSVRTPRKPMLALKIGNPISEGIVFVFNLAWCVRGFKSLKRFWPYLIAFRSCISNGKPE